MEWYLQATMPTKEKISEGHREVLEVDKNMKMLSVTLKGINWSQCRLKRDVINSINQIISSVLRGTPYYIL